MSHWNRDTILNPFSLNRHVRISIHQSLLYISRSVNHCSTEFHYYYPRIVPKTYDDVRGDSLVSGSSWNLRRHLAVKLLETSIIQSHSATTAGPGPVYFNAVLLPDVAMKSQSDNYSPRQTVSISNQEIHISHMFSDSFWRFCFHFYALILCISHYRDD